VRRLLKPRLDIYDDRRARKLLNGIGIVSRSLAPGAALDSKRVGPVDAKLNFVSPGAKTVAEWGVSAILPVDPHVSPRPDRVDRDRLFEIKGSLERLAGV